MVIGPQNYADFVTIITRLALGATPTVYYHEHDRFHLTAITGSVGVRLTMEEKPASFHTDFPDAIGLTDDADFM